MGSCIRTDSTSYASKTGGCSAAKPAGQMPRGIKSLKVAVKVKAGQAQAIIDARINDQSTMYTSGARVDHKAQQVFITVSTNKNFKAKTTEVVDAQRTVFLPIDTRLAAGKTYTVNLTDSAKPGNVIQSTSITFDKIGRCGG